MKCNDDYGVVRILANCGAGFDCASRNEIQKILSLGVEPSRIIYANPCKQASMIKYAAKNNVEMMTFDSEAELQKIKCLFPDAKLVLRILPPSNFQIKCKLGMKFGCNPAKARPLLQTALALELNVIGVSFHVGSGCKEAEAFAAAIQQARMVFNLALEMGFHMTVLDIGGGYPGQENAGITFSEIAIVINRALDKYFPDGEGVEIIAEPGRYMVASAFTLAVNIIAKKIVARDMLEENDEIVPKASTSDEQTIMYYVNDGIYGSFNCLFFDNDHQTVTIRTLKDEEEATYECSVWGPTCDSIDCIVKSAQLPMHEVGDWLYIQDMGAYTVAAASTFNGMQPPSKMYHCLEELWHHVKSQHDNFESQ